MPVVKINDATFADLKSIATWLGTKTPSETIDRIVRETMERLDMERDDEPKEVVATTADGAMQFETAPELLFTKPLAASINGKAMHSSSWLSILLTMIGQVKVKGFEGEKLVRELKIPAKADPYDEEGFKYHPNLGESRCKISQPRTAGRKWTAWPRSGASRSPWSSGGGKTRRPNSPARWACCGQESRTEPRRRPVRRHSHAPIFSGNSAP